MKILVALDASPTANTIVREIASRAWPQETAMHLLYVVKPTALTSNFVDVESYVGTEAGFAEELITSYANLLRRHQISAFAVVKKGQPGKVIVEYAKQWGADNIIIGPSHHHGLSAFFLGSTAREVLRHAPCSVEMIRATPAKPKSPGDEVKVLLATDGSSCSLAAARAVAAREWPPQTQVKVISAIPQSVAAIEPFRGLRFSGADLTAQEFLVDPVQNAIATTRKVIEDAGLEVSEEVLYGNPRQAITEQATDWQADLLVVGSHGRHGLERFLDGSVSEAVMLQAPCNVWVVHKD